MSRLSSSAPQIGAALAAGLMLLSALAFQIGAGAEAEAPAEQSSVNQDVGRDARLFFTAAAWGSRERDIAEPDRREVPSQHTMLRLDEPNSAQRPQLAIILDDVADLATAERVWSLSVPVTIAILPYAEQSRLIAERAEGREIFLHLPMEPVGLQDPGPNALTKTLEGDTLAARVRWALDQVPGATGFNNHMGSRLTADGAAMAQVFDALDGQQERLLFVDSLTHPGSVARETALGAGFKAFDRDVFLDHDPSQPAIEAQLDAALEQAQETGQAIAIGHPREATFAALDALAEKADAAGVEIVPVGRLVQH